MLAFEPGPDSQPGGGRRPARALRRPSPAPARRSSSSPGSACCWSSRGWSCRRATQCFVDDMLVNALDGLAAARSAGRMLATAFVLQVAADLAPADAPAAARSQARARDVEPLLLARASPAGRVLQPALRRRHRHSRRSPTTGSRACWRATAAGDGDCSPRAGALRRRDVLYDPVAGGHRRGGSGAQLSTLLRCV